MKKALINGKWELSLPDHMADRSKWERGWEVERQQAIRDALGTPLGHRKVIFDIGAEQGDLPGLYASWGATVVPFEPNPYVWPNIKAVWDYNQLSTPPAYWVGFASDKTVKQPSDIESAFNEPERDGWPGCAYGPLITEHGFRNVCERFHDTPQITVDDFIEKHTNYTVSSSPKMETLIPDVITIDVEGAELIVLRGSRTTLLANKVDVFVSIHPEIMKQAYDHTKDQLIDFMNSIGYEGEHLATDHEEHWFYHV